MYHVVDYPYWAGYGTYLPYRLNGNGVTFEKFSANGTVAPEKEVNETEKKP